jgi:hypothetical protein
MDSCWTLLINKVIMASAGHTTLSHVEVYSLSLPVNLDPGCGTAPTNFMTNSSRPSTLAGMDEGIICELLSSIASVLKEELKISIGVNLGYCHHHPGNNVFHSPPSTNPLIRSNFEIISLIPFGWKPKAVLQQTYIQNINPTYNDILLRGDYPQLSKAVDQLGQPLNTPPADSAPNDQVTPTLLPSGPPAADFPVPDTAPATGLRSN